jgi:hypothetical protein
MFTITHGVTPENGKANPIFGAEQVFSFSSQL